MKIIYAADIHGAFDRIKELLNESIADIYIIAGDLIDIPFYNIDTAIRYEELQTYFNKLRKEAKEEQLSLDDFIENVINSPEVSESVQEKGTQYQSYTIRARRVMQQKYKILENILLNKKYSKILCLPGNYDMDLKYTSLYDQDLHLHRYHIENQIIAGYGGADIHTPGFPEKYLVEYKAGRNIKDSNNEMLCYFKAVKPAIVVCHQPAYGIHDRLQSFGPSGSPALRFYCDNNPVKLCLTGHIHNDWGFIFSEGTVYLNPSNFGEITLASGEVIEGGSFYNIEFTEAGLKSVMLQKFANKKIFDIAEYTKKDNKWEEEIIDNERFSALKRNENYDTTNGKYSHIHEINLYNDIKNFFRIFQTKETEERVDKLEQIIKLIEHNIEGIAMDIAGSVNMGLSQPSSDIDIVLYLRCNNLCEKDLQECLHLLYAKKLIKESLNGEYNFEIIDCIDLNHIEKCIKDKNYECDAAQRFVAYRAMFRPINYKFVASIEDLLNQDKEFRKELEGSVRSYLKILANTSDHIYSFEKYKARLTSLGIKIPKSIKGKIKKYLQVVKELE